MQEKNNPNLIKKKIMLIKDIKNKKYKLYGFYTIKENNDAIDEEIENFKRNNIDYDIQIHELPSGKEKDIIHDLHENMAMISYQNFDGCPIPDITKYIV